MDNSSFRDTGSRLWTWCDHQKRDVREDQWRRNGGVYFLWFFRAAKTIVLAELLRVLRSWLYPVRVEPVVSLSRRLREGDYWLWDEIPHCNIAIAGWHYRLYRSFVGDPRLPHTTLHDLRLGTDPKCRRYMPQIGRTRGFGMWVIPKYYRNCFQHTANCWDCHVYIDQLIFFRL